MAGQERGADRGRGREVVGYLLGFPLASGAYINAGVTLTVW